jgi:uncharacterized protein (TIGR03067 family)
MRRALLAALVVGLVAGADDKKDGDALKGTWTIVSVVREGNANQEAEGGKITFDGENITIETKDKHHKGTYKLTPSKKHIDITPGDGPESGKVMRGIYSLKDDELKICLAGAEKERPGDFEAKADSGHHLVTLKREK